MNIEAPRKKKVLSRKAMYLNKFLLRRAGSTSGQRAASLAGYQAMPYQYPCPQGRLCAPKAGGQDVL